MFFIPRYLLQRINANRREHLNNNSEDPDSYESSSEEEEEEELQSQQASAKQNVPLDWKATLISTVLGSRQRTKVKATTTQQQQAIEDYYQNPKYHDNIGIKLYLHFGRLCKSTVQNDYFNYFVLFIIILAGALVGIETYPGMTTNPLIVGLDTGVLGVFIFELALKVFAEGLLPHRYFTNTEWKWNWFDCTIVILSLPLWGSLFGGGSLKMLRLIRLTRLGKIVRKIPPLQMIIRGIIGGVNSCGYITLLQILVFYIFSVVGYYLFQHSDPFHFGSVPYSIFTLFRLYTLDDWGDFMWISTFGCNKYLDMYQPYNQDTPENYRLWCRSPQAIVYFPIFCLVFILLGQMVILSLFIGAISNSMMDAMESIEKEREESKRQQLLEKNKQRMLTFVRPATSEGAVTGNKTNSRPTTVDSNLQQLSTLAADQKSPSKNQSQVGANAAVKPTPHRRTGHRESISGGSVANGTFNANHLDAIQRLRAESQDSYGKMDANSDDGNNNDVLMLNNTSGDNDSSIKDSVMFTFHLIYKQMAMIFDFFGTVYAYCSSKYQDFKDSEEEFYRGELKHLLYIAMGYEAYEILLKLQIKELKLKRRQMSFSPKPGNILTRSFFGNIAATTNASINNTTTSDNIDNNGNNSSYITFVTFSAECMHWIDDHAKYIMDPVALYHACSLFAKEITESKSFNNFVTFVILCAAVDVGIETDYRLNALPVVKAALNVTDKLILSCFTLEMCLKMLAEDVRPWAYFYSGWNCFDFIIVMSSYFSGAGSFLLLLRLLRLLRVLKLVKRLPKLAIIIHAFLLAGQSIGWALVLLFLFHYVFGIIGFMLFNTNDPHRFDSLHKSMISVFRLISLDDSSYVAYINAWGCDVYPDLPYHLNPQWCRNPKGWGLLSFAYYIVLVMIGNQILLSLFIGVLSTSLDQARTMHLNEEQSNHDLDKFAKTLYNVHPYRVKCFREVFKRLDLDGSGQIEEDEELRIVIALLRILETEVVENQYKLVDDYYSKTGSTKASSSKSNTSIDSERSSEHSKLEKSKANAISFRKELQSIAGHMKSINHQPIFMSEMELQYLLKAVGSKELGGMDVLQFVRFASSTPMFQESELISHTVLQMKQRRKLRNFNNTTTMSFIGGVTAWQRLMDTNKRIHVTTAAGYEALASNNKELFETNGEKERKSIESLVTRKDETAAPDSPGKYELAMNLAAYKRAKTIQIQKVIRGILSRIGMARRGDKFARVIRPTGFYKLLKQPQHDNHHQHRQHKHHHNHNKHGHAHNPAGGDNHVQIFTNIDVSNGNNNVYDSENSKSISHNPYSNTTTEDANHTVAFGTAGINNKPVHLDHINEVSINNYIGFHHSSKQQPIDVPDAIFDTNGVKTFDHMDEEELPK